MVDEKKRTEADSQLSMLWVDGIERFISMRKQAERKVSACATADPSTYRSQSNPVPAVHMAHGGWVGG
jgi:hypothetical protein